MRSSKTCSPILAVSHQIRWQGGLRTRLFDLLESINNYAQRVVSHLTKPMQASRVPV